MDRAEKRNFKDSRYKVPNLERALVIMEHLLEYPGGRTLTELTTDLELSKNSVFRIAMTLLDHGFLLRDDQKRFCLSKKLLMMGCRTIGEDRFIEHALDVMRECRDEVKESVFIGTLVGSEGVVIEQAPGLHSFKFTIDSGMRMPLHCAAPCKAMLAFLPENESKRLLKECAFERYNDNTITDRKIFTKELAEIRKCGYALDRAEQVCGAQCVSAPVFDSYGYPVAAIWMTGPADRVSEDLFESLGEVMRRYADKISRRMGYKVL